MSILLYTHMYSWVYFFILYFTPEYTHMYSFILLSILIYTHLYLYGLRRILMCTLRAPSALYRPMGVRLLGLAHKKLPERCQKKAVFKLYVALLRHDRIFVHHPLKCISIYVSHIIYKKKPCIISNSSLFQY